MDSNGRNAATAVKLQVAVTGDGDRKAGSCDVAIRKTRAPPPLLCVHAGSCLPQELCAAQVGLPLLQRPASTLSFLYLFLLSRTSADFSIMMRCQILMHVRGVSSRVLTWCSLWSFYLVGWSVG